MPSILSNEFQRIARDVTEDTSDSILLDTFFDSLFSRLPNQTREALWICSITHWFNLEILLWLNDGKNKIQINAEECIQEITKLTFVMPYRNLGYSYHEDIQAYFISRWRKEEMNKYVELNKRAAKYFAYMLSKAEGSELDLYLVELEYHREVSGQEISELQLYNKRVTINLLEKGVQKHRPGLDDKTKKAISLEVLKVLEKNIKSGRVKRFREKSENTKESAKNFNEYYIDLVIQNYLQESDLVNRLKAQDLHAWKELFVLVERHARYMLRDNVIRSTAQDIAQDVASLLIKSEYSYDIPFQAWVVAITKNVSLAKARSRRDLLEFADSSIDSDLESEAIQISDASQKKFTEMIDRDLLISALRKMSPLQQQVIEYSFFEDLTDSEIAQRLGKTTSAVQVIRYRALQTLRDILIQMQ